MEVQEDGDSFMDEVGSAEDIAAPDTAALPAAKKSSTQINFFKDRTSGMYKCQMCSYKSMHRSSIKSHYAVHSSLRPYACDQCSYEAKRLNDLRKHKLIKHGKKLISVRKKHSSSLDSSRAESNGVTERSESDNNDSHMEDPEVDAASSGNLLYQSLLHGGTGSNGPVFPQPEPASLMSSPDTMNSPPRRERSISTGDIPDDVDKEGTVVVKPEPPDDYYTFQNKFPEQDESIVIPTQNPPAHSEATMKPTLDANSPKSPGRSMASPAASLKSVAQSTSKDSTESEATRIHAASPSVISLLLQRRNLTGSTLLSAAALNASQPTSSQPKPLKPIQPRPTHSSGSNTSNSSSGNFYTPDSRFSAPQYNPLNLSYQQQQQQQQQHQQQPTRSSSESSSHSSSLPSSTSGRSRGVETKRGWACDHCNIMFFDSAIYFMHMGLHSPESAWQCNLCGQQLYDVYSFTSHFVNGHVST